MEQDSLHFPLKKRLESYLISEDIIEQQTQDLLCPQQQATRLGNLAPVRTLLMLLKHSRRIGLQRNQGQIWNQHTDSKHES